MFTVVILKMQESSDHQEHSWRLYYTVRYVVHFTFQKLNVWLSFVIKLKSLPAQGRGGPFTEFKVLEVGKYKAAEGLVNLIGLIGYTLTDSILLLNDKAAY